MSTYIIKINIVKDYRGSCVVVFAKGNMTVLEGLKFTSHCLAQSDINCKSWLSVVSIYSILVELTTSELSSV